MSRTPPQKGKCAKCGGALHWYNTQIPNPDGGGELCEKCSKQVMKNLDTRARALESSIYSVTAKDVSESMIKSLTNQYIMVYDSTSHPTLNNLMYAINLLAQNGWVLAGFSTNLNSIGFDAAWAIMKKE